MLNHSKPPKDFKTAVVVSYLRVQFRTPRLVYAALTPGRKKNEVSTLVLAYVSRPGI
jgi:hypothetical protein